MSYLIVIYCLFCIHFVIAQFNIELAFNPLNIPQSQKQVFIQAAARWTSIITGDTGSTINIQKGQVVCNQPAALAPRTVDDILIFINVAPIDGKGNFSLSAGPCGYDKQGKIRLGLIQVDSEDVQEMIQTNKFLPSIEHGIGHALGIGTEWDRRQLVSPVNQTTPFVYLGAGGREGDIKVGGTGAAVAEDFGGNGTVRSHWKKSFYKDELMTGFITGSSPISKLTALSLKDLGYKGIDETKTDDFVLATKTPTTVVTKAPTVLGGTPTPTSSLDAGSFNFLLVFDDENLLSDEVTILQRAAGKWLNVISADIGSTVTIPPGVSFCGHVSNAPFVIDNIALFIEVAPIDTAGGVLAQAGPCLTDNAGRIRGGEIVLDIDDILRLKSEGKLLSTIAHEIGHILGIGTLWDARSLVRNSVSPPGFLVFGGANAKDGQTLVGGAGLPVVEDCCGAGTARGHWKETIYQNELMTGFFSGTDQPLSVLTVLSLVDLGYTVDATQADLYEIPQGRRLRNTKKEERKLQDTGGWEQPYNGSVLFGVPTKDKKLGAEGEDWEKPFFVAAVTFDATPKPDDLAPIIGGVSAGVFVLAALAFVVIRRRRNRQSLRGSKDSSNFAQMRSDNPEYSNFGNPQAWAHNVRASVTNFKSTMFPSRYEAPVPIPPNQQSFAPSQSSFSFQQTAQSFRASVARFIPTSYNAPPPPVPGFMEEKKMAPPPLSTNMMRQPMSSSSSSMSYQQQMMMPQQYNQMMPQQFQTTSFQQMPPQYSAPKQNGRMMMIPPSGFNQV